MLSGSSLRVQSTGVDSTRAAAHALAKVLSPSQVVLLNGELGAGKTAFTQGLAAALGVDEPVTSPTFSMMNTYECGSAGDVRTLVHIDSYRLGGSEGIEFLGVDELLREGAVAVIEWGELVRDAFPEASAITITWVGDEVRELVFSDFAEATLQTLADLLSDVGLEPCS